MLRDGLAVDGRADATVSERLLRLASPKRERERERAAAATLCWRRSGVSSPKLQSDFGCRGERLFRWRCPDDDDDGGGGNTFAALAARAWNLQAPPAAAVPADNATSPVAAAASNCESEPTGSDTADDKGAANSGRPAAPAAAAAAVATKKTNAPPLA